MEKLNNSSNNVLQNLMVKCMLNPDNKDFYIGRLTTERVEQLLTTFNDEEFTEMFWNAFEIAQAHFIKTTQDIKKHFDNACPVCCCTTYKFGAKCPNCDYIEN